MVKEFYVHGMHCSACELLIETKLAKLPGVTNVRANLSSSKVYIESDDELDAKALSQLVANDGYIISTEKGSQTKIDLRSLSKGLAIALIIFGSFMLLQKAGLINLINPKQVTLPFVFLIGIVASLSTCAAVVGGLVLSLSTNFAKERNYIPLIAFHVARLAGFFILGGLIGLLGSAIILTGFGYLVLNLAVFGVMVLMGLNLLDVFSVTQKVRLKIPRNVGKYTLALQNKGGATSAILMGTLTFILPCGFTQSMQIYSLTTGNFLTGALTMFVFALGTLPVLSLISFASIKIHSKTFFAAAGFLVLFFAFFNLFGALKSTGIYRF
jgi:uncharacterized protein